MALVWAHGFETGADYNAYKNDGSNDPVMPNEGWRLFVGAAGAPADAVRFDATEYLFTGRGAMVSAPTKPAYDFYGSYAMNIGYDSTEVGPVSITEGTTYSEIAVNFAFGVRPGIRWDNGGYLINFVHNNENYSSRKTLQLKPTTNDATSTFELLLKSGGVGLSVVATTTNSFSVGEWHTCAIHYSHTGTTTTVVVYINGQQECTATITNTSIYNGVQRFEFGQAGMTGVTLPGTWIDSITCWDAPATDPWTRDHYIFGLSPGRDPNALNLTPSTGSQVFPLLTDRDSTTYGENTTGTTGYFSVVDPISKSYETSFGNRDIKGISVCAPLIQGNNSAGDKTRITVGYRDKDKLNGQNSAQFNGFCVNGYQMRHNIATQNPWRLFYNSTYGTTYTTEWVRSDLDENLLGGFVYNFGAGPGSDSFRVSELALEVVWSGLRDDNRAAGYGTRTVEVPESYIIWPGPGTTDVLKLDDTYEPSQDGPFADVAFPVAGNNGSMLLFQHGSWDRVSQYQEPQDVQYVVCQGGGLGHIAEYVWKNESDESTTSSDSYRGYNGLPYIWGSHGPFTPASDTYWHTLPDNASLSVKVEDGMCVGYSSLYSRLFYVRWGRAQSNIVIRYRSTIGDKYTEETDATVWNQYLLPNRGKTGSTRFPYNRRIGNWGVQPSLIELPDGTLQLYHIYLDESENNGAYEGNDFMIYQSDDGGLTWDIVNERVMLNNFGHTVDIRHCIVASSGDWIRFDFYTAQVSLAGVGGVADAGRQTLVSSDRGATWKQLYQKKLTIADDGYATKIINPLAGAGIPDGSLSAAYKNANYYATAAMAGIGDDAGTFIRIHSVQTGSMVTGQYGTQIERASRDETWTRFDEPSAIVGGLPQVCSNLIQLDCVAGGGFVYAYAYATFSNGSDPAQMAFDGGVFFQIPFESIPDYRYYNVIERKWEGSWGQSQRFGGRGDQGEYHHAPAHLRSVWAGDRIVRFYRTQRTTTKYNASSGVMETMFTAHALSTAMVSDFIGGWTQLPLRNKHRFNALQIGESAKIRWTSGMGVWNGNTTGLQDFQETVAPAGQNTFTWNHTQMCADHTAYGGPTLPGDRCTVFITDSISSLTTHIMDHGVVGFVTRRNPNNPLAGQPAFSLPDLATTEPAWGCRVRSGSGTFRTSAYGGLTQFCDVYLALAKNGTWALYDNIAGTTLYDSATTGIGWDSSKFFKWRLAFCNSRQLLTNTSTVTDNKYYVRLLYKVEETDAQFQATPLLTLTTTGAPAFGQNQIVGWGSFKPGNAFGRFQYRELFVQDRDVMGLHELNRTDPTTYRGAPVNSSDFAVGKCGYQARWGGASAFFGDEFVGNVAYQFGVKNLNAPSPAQVWRTKDASTQGILKLHADALDPSGDEYYNHNAIAILNCNVRKPVVSYAATTSFSGSSDFTIDLTKHTVTAASVSATGNFFTVTDHDATKFSDSELVDMYADILYADGTQQSYKVRRNTGNRVYLSGLTQALTNNMSPLDTVAFFDGYGATIFDGSQGLSRKAMKITLPVANTAEGNLFMGGYVAGMTLPFSVPMDWQMRDTQEPNVQMFESDRGTRSAYLQGPPRRNLRGKVTGDVSRWRDAFRGLMANIADYSTNPIVLVTDHARPNNSMLYCRYNGSTTNQNAAWKYNKENGQWERIGDLQVEFVEEV